MTLKGENPQTFCFVPIFVCAGEGWDWLELIFMENLKQSNLKLLPLSTVSTAIEEMYTLFLEQP